MTNSGTQDTGQPSSQHLTQSQPEFNSSGSLATVISLKGYPVRTINCFEIWLFSPGKLNSEDLNQTQRQNLESEKAEKVWV